MRKLLNLHAIEILLAVVLSANHSVYAGDHLAQVSDTEAQPSRFSVNTPGALVPAALPCELPGCDADSDRRMRHDKTGHARDNDKRRLSIPPDVKVLRDLQYSNGEGDSLPLDLYLPEDRGVALPALLVWIHGGGWTRGDKSRINPVFVRLVSDHYATASINYSLSGIRSHPRQLGDVNAAIRWLRSQAGRFGYDADRIAVGGASAGGHLAMLSALTGDAPPQLDRDSEDLREESPEVQAVVSMFGPSDLESLARTRQRFGRNKSPELLRKASPVNYISPGDPPLLLIHGDRDPVVPVAQSQRLLEQYTKAGLFAQLEVVEGAGHGGRPFKSPAIGKLVKSFLDRHLHADQSATSGQVDDHPTRASSQPAKLAAAQQESKEQRLNGFLWMIGPRSGLSGSDEEFEQLLAEVDENLRTNQCIDGVYISQHWELVEPKPGDYQFARLDRLLSVVRSHGRYYKLSINPGIYTPHWLYAAGAEAFETTGANPSRESLYQRPVRIPIPWDPIYQQYYYRLLAEVARRYGADPAFRAIAVTAATFMSAEWHLPRSERDLKRWSQLGDYPKKLQQAWINGIDRFAALFPAQVLVLHASSYPIRLKEVGEAIVHHGATEYARRFAVQINQLMGRYDQRQRPTYRKLLEYRERYGDDITIGLQNLKGWTFPNSAKKQGSMEMSAYNFVQANGSYWELWYGDGKSPARCEALHRLRDEIRSVGIASFRSNLEAQGKYMPDPGPRSRRER